MSDKQQLELICGDCPLERCNEQSLWCAFRMLTDPNEAQLRLLDLVPQRASKIAKSIYNAKRVVVRKRTKYQSDHYKANRERKLAASNKRNAELRMAKMLRDNNGLLS